MDKEIRKKVEEYAETIQALTLDFRMGKFDEKHYLMVLSMCVNHIEQIVKGKQQ